MTVRRLTFRDYLDALTERRVDLAFVRPDPHDERFAAVPLSSEARVAVSPARHRLAAAEAVTADDVLDEPFIGIDREVPGSLNYVHLNQVRQGSRACTVDAGCADVTDVLAAVSAGRGMATAVESFRGFENWPGVCYVPITGIEPETNVLVSRRGDPSPLVAAFLASAEHTLASASGPLQEMSPARATGDRRQAPGLGKRGSVTQHAVPSAGRRRPGQVAAWRARAAAGDAPENARRKRDRHDSGQSPGPVRTSTVTGSCLFARSSPRQPPCHARGLAAYL